MRNRVYLGIFDYQNQSGLESKTPAEMRNLASESANVFWFPELVIENFKGEDVALVKDQLTRLRNELSQLDVQISDERRLINQEARMPSKEEIHQTIIQLPKILRAAVEDETSDEFDLARELLPLLTGGHIEMIQKGEKAARRGWLQAKMKINLAAVAVRSRGRASRHRLNKRMPVLATIVFEFSREDAACMSN